ncbi:protein mono-ADP-ribosyltransferase PARP3-like isoform X2 [Hydractinia symbiolongicarpus]|uniref:protein mono-ADP-ribosyltransferase PARP3-like isoform X2 n=1 Tax=Hydractinia symbiolongicarpus TaxID=13093 RepID=UPI00255134F2|nr:protein mono-ADP-ribosyltransferase PARP3-like isoform X2 [Hydractinia symbiolongicarpus]
MHHVVNPTQEIINSIGTARSHNTYQCYHQVSMEICSVPSLTVKEIIMPPKRKIVSKSKTSNEDTDFSKLSVAKLKEECKLRSLACDGRKADLIKRLQEDESQGTTSKKIKQEQDKDKTEEKLSMKDKLKALVEEEKKNKRKTFQVDSNCPRYNSGRVVDDYDCMLNQTNIGANNNKFYVIQLIQDGGKFFLWNRWGRVGECGQSAMKGPFDDQDSAVKEFHKKFKDKTKNNWDDRSDFKPASGKYTMIEMDAQDETDNQNMEKKLANLDSTDGTPAKITKPCCLDAATQSLIKLIFDQDMFKEAMSQMNIDVKKMPLGKLSKTQIAKGFEILEDMENELKKKTKNKLQELTSTFYTLIPHNFGRQRPPTITDAETLQLKMDMLTILGDIELAQDLQKVKVKREQLEEPHPLDVNYGLLKCGLTRVKPSENAYKVISKYIDNTKSSGGIKLLDIWEVDRQDEDKRFAAHKDIENRKLLWHGTSVAVVVAILKSGLRIMPHSGGRVGRGIYLASEHAKSAAYVGTSRDGTGIMFLSEATLGKQHVITRDDSSLTKPPKGFDSVLAEGRQEPDPKQDTTLNLDGNDVIVPQGKPVPTKSTNSSFHQSEYLLYQESQCRIRYLLKFKFR